MTALTPEECADIEALRRRGVSIPDVVVAMEYFRGVHVSYGQVRRLSSIKLGLQRGARPLHARGRS